MNSDEQNNALLPAGFMDLLPPDAELQASSVNALTGLFSGFGYERVKPPLAEFEESLLGDGPGSTLAQSTFRIMDPVTHRMMGVRSDATPQISRIASTRLKDAPRPLRLTYANDVMRTRAGQNRLDRQFMQVGCEIIGASHVQEFAEVIILSALGLNEIGLEGVTVDLTLPGLTKQIFEINGVAQAQRAEILEALGRRDQSYFDGNNDVPAIFGALLKTQNDPELGLELLAEHADIKHLQIFGEVYGIVKNAFADLGLGTTISFDPFEEKGFQYHSEIGFTLFARSVSGELGRGGKYTLGNGEVAAGFTLYMDTIQTGLKVLEEKTPEDASFDASWAGLLKKVKAGEKLRRVE